MTLPHVRISGMPGTPVFVLDVDGHDIKDGVSAADLKLRPGEPCELTLDVCAPEVEVDGQARVVILDETRETLIKLGWTPPEPEDDGGTDARA